MNFQSGQFISTDQRLIIYMHGSGYCWTNIVKVLWPLLQYWQFLSKIRFYAYLQGGRGFTSQHWKFRQHNFEIAVDPKGPSSGPTFWSGLEALNHKGHAWWPHPFSRQKWPINKDWKISIINWISHHQSIDNSILISRKNFESIGLKMAELWPKNVCTQIWACAPFLAISWPNMNILEWNQLSNR